MTAQVLLFEAEMDRVWREFLAARQALMLHPTPELAIAAGKATGALMEAMACTNDAEQEAFLARQKQKKAKEGRQS